jgi:hypothetical protein
LNRLVNLRDIWQGGDAIQRDRDAVSFNPIVSTILKWLRFKTVSWRHDFQPSMAMVWDCLIVGLLLRSMATKLYISVKLS